MSAGPHRIPLARLGLETSQAEALGAYLDLLERWSARVNLTAARTAEERVAVLVAPVLQALPALAGGRDLIDLGSGNGSPGLVLALLRPDLAVRLLEPRGRRWAFLREAVRVLGANRTEVLRERHDQHRGPAAERLSLRALRLDAEELTPLLVPGGRVLSWGPAWGARGGWRVALQSPGFQVIERCFT